MSKAFARKSRFSPPAPESDMRGPVLFARCSDYMKHCGGDVRRKLRFLDASGSMVRVVHAFPLLKSAFPEFIDEQDRFGLRYVAIEPEPGWHVYALPWNQVQAFVATDVVMWNRWDGHARTSDVPPSLLRFRRRHAAGLEPERTCSCGSPSCDYAGWTLRVSMTHQVVFSPVRLARVTGASA